ncbi:hypothetical protein ASPZODRAFT_54773 [Penicilliopsis zonata CBS 506.65]|uniref:Peptidase A1 domain-containing protein n=1 Tax=Penicilliopsis zonata CBS 506.65 TaxID=1073090 RepID=A0A1L9SUG9_9EURO|nr:hypothetical protein ASPZODRAFT_54773 [Penicilliopsis zonata CBS 506.65]OJJ50737.1 hypothetical protein ASPZODRAFT_54773 [Penicilliopsis zonata CBS 506.65]
MALKTRNTSVSLSNHTAGMLATEYGTIFDVDVTVGNQTFQLQVDTGSSDLWVAKTGFICINQTSNLELPEEECEYSSHLYNISDTYRQIANETFGVQYGDGIVGGAMAYEDITLGGITVKGQKIGIGERSTPMGDGVNSGLIGLAYPALTSAHPGTNISNTSYFYDRAVYSPLFNTMYERGLVDPYFSITLARTPQNSSSGFGGYLSLGELPPVAHSPNFSVVPVEVTENIPLNFTSGKRVRSYWSISISGATYGPASNGSDSDDSSSSSSLTTNSTSFQAFVDSGNYVSFLPAAIVDPINKMFSPPATYDASLSAWVVDCAATAPTFGLQIGNQTFFHNGSDLIYQLGDICITSLTSSESVAYEGVVLNIIGVPLLKNVVAVFDFGNNEMRFSRLLDNETAAANTSTSQVTSGESPAVVRPLKSTALALSAAVLLAVLVG